MELPHHGNSMCPTIPDGVKIRVCREDRDTASAGQIVAVATDQGVVTHRIIYRGTRGLGARYVLTRGDARRLPDSPAPLESVLGIVTAVWVDDGWRPVSDRDRGADGWIAASSASILRIALDLNVTLAFHTFRVITVVRRSYHHLRRMLRISRPTP